MTEDIEYGVLAGKKAIDKWRGGIEAWNAWVEENPELRVDFSGVDFNQYRTQVPLGIISFTGFKFPNGGVSFESAQFGDGGVSFESATFGKGGVNFEFAQFGNGYVVFRGATFGDGNVSFTGATFGNGNVNFYHATFGDGDVSFNNATFGDGDVSFNNVTFGNGDVVFVATKFGDGIVSFHDAEFGNGDVYFIYAICNDQFVFKPKKTGKINYLTFYGCSFKGVMILNGTYNCVPDLRNTITSSHVDLMGLKIIKGYKKNLEGRLKEPATEFAKDQWIKDQLKEWEKDLLEKPTDDQKGKQEEEFEKKWNPDENQKIVDDKFKELVSQQNEETSAQFCRLKELAEQNRAHDKALVFFAEECAVNRENQNKAWVWLDKAYAGACRHGRSIGRPVLGLFLSWVVFSGIYCSIILLTNKFVTSSFLGRCWEVLCAYVKSFLLCIFNSVPFLGFTRHGYNNIFSKLFGSEPSFWVYMPIGLQSLIAFIFLFLIGLGIRNRFRI